VKVNQLLLSENDQSLMDDTTTGKEKTVLLTTASTPKQSNLTADELNCLESQSTRILGLRSQTLNNTPSISEGAVSITLDAMQRKVFTPMHVSSNLQPSHVSGVHTQLLKPATGIGADNSKQ
jgi:hypothetical protein